jgi:hypothetical protein
MPRPYSEEFLRFINTTDSNNLGVSLGKSCVRGNLPLLYVARALGVSKVTIFNWFRGRGMRENMRSKVEVFLETINRDLESGILPASTHKEAVFYIRAISGEKNETDATQA